VTLLHTSLAGGRHGSQTFIYKLPVVIEPDVIVRLELALEGPGGFFFEATEGVFKAQPSEGKPHIEIGPCPRGETRDSVLTGMGLFITLTRPTCTRLTAESRGRRQSTRLALGSARCRAQ
jgi:hypothetical protein